MESSLEVHVLAARNLMQCGVEKAPSTFCKIKLGRELYGTDIVPNSFHPKWHTIATFRNIDKSVKQKKALKVLVFTKKKAFVGMVRIPLESVLQEAKIEKWFPLTNKKGLKRPKITGDVQLSIQYTGPKNIESPADPKKSVAAKPKEEAQVDFAKKPNEQAEKERKLLLGEKAAGKEYEAKALPIEYNSDDEASMVQATERLKVECRQNLSRCVEKIDQTANTAVQTQSQLQCQGKKLMALSEELETVDAQLDLGKKYIRGIKSVFGNVGKRRNMEAEEKAFGMSQMPKSMTPQVERVSEVAQRNKLGLIPKRSHSVDDMEGDLDHISQRVLQLRDLAISMGAEIEGQSETINILHGQVEKNYTKIQMQRAEIQKL